MIVGSPVGSRWRSLRPRQRGRIYFHRRKGGNRDECADRMTGVRFRAGYEQRPDPFAVILVSPYFGRSDNVTMVKESESKGRLVIIMLGVLDRLAETKGTSARYGKLAVRLSG